LGGTGVAAVLVALLLCTWGPERSLRGMGWVARGGTALLSRAGKAGQLAGIENWERSALSGVKGGHAVSSGAGDDSKRDQLAMVQQWEDQTLSGRRHRAAVAQQEEREGGGQQQAVAAEKAPVSAQTAAARAASQAATANDGRRRQQLDVLPESSGGDEAAADPRGKYGFLEGMKKPEGGSSCCHAACNGVKNSADYHCGCCTGAAQPVAAAAARASPAGSKSATTLGGGLGKEAARSHTPEGAMSSLAAQREEAKSRQLVKKAARESSEAKKLVRYAQGVAQRIIAERAMDAMKGWLAKHKEAVARSKHSTHRAMLAGGAKASDGQLLKGELGRVRSDAARLESSGELGKRAFSVLAGDLKAAQEVGEKIAAEHHAKSAAETKPAVAPKPAPAPKPAAPRAVKAEAPEAKIRREYDAWRKTQVHDYVDSHNLFSASEFCNSRDNTDHPTVSELVKLFGPQWHSMTLRDPEVASLAAVTPCLAALGAAPASGIAPKAAYDAAWSHGALKGKEDAVRKCAGGDTGACAAIAKDPVALRALKHLIPKKLLKEHR